MDESTEDIDQPHGKARLRAAMRARRDAMARGEREAASRAICGALAGDEGVSRALSPPRGVATLATYLAARSEPDLSAFIRLALASGARVVAPRWNGRTYDLAVLRGLSGANLRSGPMGIPEPADAETVHPSQVAVWLVPGLAFTRDGGRVGYGGGWYDRLLAEASGDSLKIGVAFPFQVVESLPSEPHDARLSRIVTGQ